MRTLSYYTGVFKMRTWSNVFVTVEICLVLIITGGSHAVFVTAPGHRYVHSGQSVKFIWTFDISLSDVLIDIKLTDGDGYIISWADDEWGHVDGRYQPFENNTAVGFTLREVTDSDGGLQFECKVFYDGQSHLNSDAMVVIDRPPKNMNITQKPDTLYESKDVLLTCSAQGNSIPVELARDVGFTWYSGSIQIIQNNTQDKKHTFMEAGTLLIKDLRITDGPYTCRAKENGSKSHSERIHNLVVQTTISPDKDPTTPQHHVTILPTRNGSDDGSSENGVVKPEVNSTQAIPANTAHFTDNPESGLQHFLKYGAGPLAIAVLLLVLVFILAKFASVLKSKRKASTQEKTSLVHPDSTNHMSDPQSMIPNSTSPVRSMDTVSFRREQSNGANPANNRNTYCEIKDEVYDSLDDANMLSRKSVEIIKSKPPNVPPNRPAEPSSSSASCHPIQEETDPYLTPVNLSPRSPQDDFIYRNLSSPLRNERNKKPGTPTDQYLTTTGASVAEDATYLPMSLKEETNPKTRERLGSDTTPKHTEVELQKKAVPNVYNSMPSSGTSPQKSPIDSHNTRSAPSEYLELVIN